MTTLSALFIFIILIPTLSNAEMIMPYDGDIQNTVNQQENENTTCQSVYKPNFRDEMPIRAKLESKYAPKQMESGNYDIAGSQDIIIELSTVRSDAWYNNSFGHYFAYDDGVPIYGVIDFINVKNSTPSVITYTEDNIPEGATQIGFFLIPDGGRLNGNIDDGTSVTFEVINEKWTPLLGVEPIEGTGYPAFFSDKKLNPCRVQHMDSFSNGIVGWEDTYGGGDRDYNDATIQTLIKSQYAD